MHEKIIKKKDIPRNVINIIHVALPAFGRATNHNEKSAVHKFGMDR